MTMTITLLDSIPPRVHDLTGYKNGKLEILSIYGRRISNTGNVTTLWNAKCSCGNTIVIASTHFVTGQTKSCGCLNTEVVGDMCKRKPKARKDRSRPRTPPVHFTAKDLLTRGGRQKDFTGMTVGQLSVIRLLGGTLYFLKDKRADEAGSKRKPLQRHVVTIWECRCTCGCVVKRNSNYLFRGKATSSCHKCSRGNSGLKGLHQAAA